MKPPLPQSFIGGSSRYVEPVVGRVVEVVAVAPTPTWGGPADSLPLVTVRPDGLVRLTKEAVVRFQVGRFAELRPGRPGEPWVLDCRPDAPQPVSETNGCWQFRSGYRLGLAFPHNSTRPRIQLAAARWPPLSAGLFALWPVG